MKKQIVGILSAIFLGLIIVVSIVVGSGGAAPPPVGPPAPPAPPAGPTSEGNSLPSGFWPYSGYHYSGYVVGIDYQSRTFLYDIGGQVVSIKTDDEDIFFRIEKRHGQEEASSFKDLKLNQLVWLRGVEIRPGWVVLKIQLSDWIKQK